MRFTYLKLSLLSLLLFSCANQSAEDSKINAILSQMTLEEKAGQMLNLGLPSVLTGDYWDERDEVVFDSVRFKKYIQKLNVGSIHNTPHPHFLPDTDTWHYTIKTIQDASLKNTCLGIPVVYGIDNIHGANYVKGSVMFPHQIGLAASRNTDLVARTAEITSYESRAASMPVELFKSLCEAMSRAGDNANAGKVREIVQEDFVNLVPNVSCPYLMEQLVGKHSVDDILQGLITAGFCSHLGYRFFLNTSKVCSSGRLKRELKEYQEKYEAFCKDITLSGLSQTLARNETFQLTMSKGTPFIVIQLAGQWPNLCFHTAQVILASILPFVEDLQLQGVEQSGESISLVYCGFKTAIRLIIRHQQRPGVVPALRELGIDVDVRMLPSQQISDERIKSSDETSLTCTTMVDSSAQTTELEIPSEEIDHQDQEDEKQVQKKLLSLESEQDEDPPTDLGSYWESKSSQLFTADEVYRILLPYRQSTTEVVQQEFFDRMETRQQLGVHPKVKPLSVDEKVDNSHERLSQQVEDLTKQLAKSNLKKEKLKRKLSEKETTIEQFSGSLEEIVDQLKQIRETSATELQKKDMEIGRLQMLVKMRSEIKDHVSCSFPITQQHYGSTTTLPSALTSNISVPNTPESSPEGSINNYAVCEHDAKDDKTQSECV